jgi:hypothetical protein
MSMTIGERNRAGVVAKQEQTTICSERRFALWQQSVFTDHAATTKETLSKRWEKLSSSI